MLSAKSPIQQKSGGLFCNVRHMEVSNVRTPSVLLDDSQLQADHERRIIQNRWVVICIAIIFDLGNWAIRPLGSMHGASRNQEFAQVSI